MAAKKLSLDDKMVEQLASFAGFGLVTAAARTEQKSTPQPPKSLSPTLAHLAAVTTKTNNDNGPKEIPNSVLLANEMSSLVLETTEVAAIGKHENSDEKFGSELVISEPQLSTAVTRDDDRDSLSGAAVAHSSGCSSEVNTAVEDFAEQGKANSWKPINLTELVCGSYSEISNGRDGNIDPDDLQSDVTITMEPHPSLFHPSQSNKTSSAASPDKVEDNADDDFFEAFSRQNVTAKENSNRDSELFRKMREFFPLSVSDHELRQVLLANADEKDPDVLVNLIIEAVGNPWLSSEVETQSAVTPVASSNFTSKESISQQHATVFETVRCLVPSSVGSADITEVMRQMDTSVTADQVIEMIIQVYGNPWLDGFEPPGASSRPSRNESGILTSKQQQRSPDSAVTSAASGRFVSDRQQPAQPTASAVWGNGPSLHSSLAPDSNPNFLSTSAGHEAVAKLRELMLPTVSDEQIRSVVLQFQRKAIERDYDFLVEELRKEAAQNGDYAVRAAKTNGPISTGGQQIAQIGGAISPRGVNQTNDSQSQELKSDQDRNAVVFKELRSLFPQDQLLDSVIWRFIMESTETNVDVLASALNDKHHIWD